MVESPIKPIFVTNKQKALNQIVLGVDIGGTATKLSIVTEAGKILAKSSFPTHATDNQDPYPQRLLACAKNLLQRQEASAELLGVGIGAPGCDPERGYINYAVNLPFSSPFPIRLFFEENLCAHTELIKDSSAAALGEKMWGGARHMDHFAVLTLGTGLGSAWYLNGNLLTGAHQLAGELGHTVHIPGGRQCSCGQRGCLETYISASGLQRTLTALMADRITDSPLRELPEQQRSAQKITEAAQAGDPLAQEALQRCGQDLGEALAKIVLQIDPEGIFLAGGLAQAGPILLDTVQEHMDKNLLSPFRGKVTVAFSELGAGTAGTLGAAAQIFRTKKYSRVHPK